MGFLASSLIIVLSLFRKRLSFAIHLYCSYTLRALSQHKKYLSPSWIIFFPWICCFLKMLKNPVEYSCTLERHMPDISLSHFTPLTRQQGIVTFHLLTVGTNLIPLMA